MRLVVSLIVMAWVQVMTSPAVASKTLRLEVRASGDTFVMRSLDHPSRPGLTAPANAYADMNALFFSLECSIDSNCTNLMASSGPEPKLFEPEDIVPALIENGDKLLGPFADLIDSATEVMFQIDSALIKMPFDLLYFRSKPLFVSKRISFTLGEIKGKPRWALDRRAEGLLVSDETADPDRAVFAIEKKFPSSLSFDVAEFGLGRLEDMKPVDFVVISAHGYVNGSGYGFISVGDRERLRSSALVRLRPKLVYFDSCNLGVSIDNLRELQAGGTVYAVAPILSNEAGESSTATIESFFSELARGATPVDALFTARKRLYAQYADDGIKNLLWRSFPFRVYRLN